MAQGRSVRTVGDSAAQIEPFCPAGHRLDAPPALGWGTSTKDVSKYDYRPVPLELQVNLG